MTVKVNKFWQKTSQRTTLCEGPVITKVGSFAWGKKVSTVSLADRDQLKLLPERYNTMLPKTESKEDMKGQGTKKIKET